MIQKEELMPEFDEGLANQPIEDRFKVESSVLLNNTLHRIKLSITDDNYANAQQALSDYTRPLLSALKSCAVFEDDKVKRDILIETIRKYEPNFLL